MRRKLVREKNGCVLLTLHQTVIQKMTKLLLFQMNTGKWVEQNTHHKIGDIPYWISNQKGPRRRNLDVKDRDLEIEKGQAGLP